MKGMHREPTSVVSPNPHNNTHQTNHHGDANDDPDSDIIQICANCCSSFGPSSSSANTSEIPTDSSQYQSSTYNSPGTFQIHETQKSCLISDSSSINVNRMLSNIYNLNFIPRLKQKYYPTTAEEELMEAEQVDFHLCSPCTDLLKSLFSLYSQFNQIRKIESLLSQQINELNSLINFSQTENQQSSSVSSDGDHGDDSNVDHQPSPHADSLCLDEEDIKPFNPLDIEPELVPDSPKICRRSTRKRSEPTTTTTTTTIQDRKKVRLEGEKPSSPISESEEQSVTIKQEEETESSEAGDDEDFGISVKPEILWGETDEEEQEDGKAASMDDNGNSDGDSSSDDLPLSEILAGLQDLQSAYDPAPAKKKKKSKTKDKNKEIATTITTPETNIQEEKKHACTVVINEEGHVCPFQTKYPQHLQRHIVNVHADETEKVKCSECNKEFKNKLTLDDHLARRHKEEPPKSEPSEKIFQCTFVVPETGKVCSHQTKKLFLLKHHMLQVHSEEKDKVKCSECNKEFKTSHYLKQHFERVHKGKGKEQYQMKLKKDRKKSKALVQEENDKGFVCPHCGVDFITRLRYTVHLRRVHDDYGTKDNLVICELCGKKYETPGRLRRHMLGAHVEERRFQCEECGMAFKTQTNLNSHRKIVHTEEGRQKFNAYSRANYQRKKLIREQKSRKEAMGAEMSSSNSESTQAPGISVAGSSFSTPTSTPLPPQPSSSSFFNFGF